MKLRGRIYCRMTIKSKLTALETGHGEIKSYLYRFKIKDEATCSCKTEEQNLEQILNNCSCHLKQRDLRKEEILKTGSLPVSKTVLTNKYLKALIIFIKQIDL